MSEYYFNSMKQASLAIDVGATKVAVGLIARDGQVLARIDVSSKVDSIQELNASLAAAITSVMATDGVVVVGAGIGSAGPIDNAKGTINPVNIAAWVGHAVVVKDGTLCACGQHGCVEAYASGTNMAKDFGVDKFEDVADAARKGDAKAVAAIEKGAGVLALGLLNAVALMDLDTIVVGGGVMSADDVYWPILVKYFEKEMKRLNFPSTVALKKATLGKDSGLVGAGLVGFISHEKGA